MGLNIARISDTGLGFCYGNDCDGKAHDGKRITGQIVNGSGNVSAEGLGVARISDILVSNCSHKNVGTIISGSPTVSVNGLNIARIGDVFIGCFGNGTPKGIIITGAGTVRG